MNISPDGVTVRFKTEPESLFEAERSGAKSNTMQIIDAYEADQIRLEPPTKIIIQHHQEIFLRTLTDIHLNYYVLVGKVIAIFSWRNGEHHHTRYNGTEQDEYVHTQSLDEQEPQLGLQDISIHLPLLRKLDLSRGEETYDEFISKLLDNFGPPPHQHTMPSDIPSENPMRSETAPATEEEEEDKKLTLIGISKGMSNILVRLTYNRSMDAVIREMYETYLDKLAEERGPMHD